MPSTFHQFRFLPAEIRIQIWSYAIEETYIVRVRLNERFYPYRPGYSSPLLRTCSESRAVAIAKQHDPQRNDCWGPNDFSYERSILYFGSLTNHQTRFANSHFLNNLEPWKIKSILFLYRLTGPLTDTTQEMALILITIGISCRQLEDVILCPISGDGTHDPIPRDIDCMTMDFPDSDSSSRSPQHWKLFQPYRGSWDLRLERGERRILRKLEGHFSKLRRTNGLQPPRVKFLRPPIDKKQEPYWGVDFFSAFLGGLRLLSSWRVGSNE